MVRRTVQWAGVGALTLAMATGCPADDGTDAMDDGADDAADGSGDDDDDDDDDDDSATDDGGVEASVFWHEDIAPIVVSRCAGCHRAGGIAPYSFETYEDTRPLAEAIVAAVDSGAMPPWGQDETDECQPKLGFKHELRLSDDDKDLLATWAAEGAAEGDPALAADIPAPPSLELEDADQRLVIPSPVTIDGDKDQFLCFSLDPELTEDAFLSAVQVNAGNEKIVHHVLIYSDPEGASAELADENGFFECSGGSISGELVGAWAPGALPNRMPEGTGMPIPAGARLVMNVHYHPTGLSSETDDSTSIDVNWHDERPDLVAQLSLAGNATGDELLPGPNDDAGKEFMIPAGAKGHTEEMRIVIPEEYPVVNIYSVGTHMHYLGVDMMIGVERANGNSECLIQTPHYSFEWQRGYEYDADLDEVPRVQGGDVLTLRCTYDNTMDNPGVVEALEDLGLDEPIDVYLGEETLDEMCLAVFGISYLNLF